MPYKYNAKKGNELSTVLVRYSAKYRITTGFNQPCDDPLANSAALLAYFRIF